MAIGELTVFEHLQKEVEDLWVRFLDLIEEHDAVGVSSNRFGKLTALIVSDVPWRGSDQSGNGKPLHVFRHVDSDDVGFLLIKVSGKGLGKLGFSDTGWSEEDEAAHGSLRIFESASASSNSSRYGDNRIVLTDDPAVKIALHLEQLLALGGDKLHHGDTGPRLDDQRDFVLVDDRFNLFSLVPNDFSLFDRFLKFDDLLLERFDLFWIGVSLSQVVDFGFQLSELDSVGANVGRRQALLEPDS